ncbi:Fluconazole resistance protein [Dirofilaria immitis]
MSTKEKLKYARTMREVLFILNMPEYLPFFEKANILQASALRLLRETDLKYIGIDSSGRQKLLKAVQYLSKNISMMTIDEKTRHYAMNINSRFQSKYSRINEGKFTLQKTQDELLRCKVELNLKRNELARIQKQAELIHEIFEMTTDAIQHIQELQKNCGECGSSLIQRLATDLESLLNSALIPNGNSNPSNKNIPPLPAVENENSWCSNIQQHLPELALKPLEKHNVRLYYSNETYSSPWYTKILKPTSIQRYKQMDCFRNLKKIKHQHRTKSRE